jgi:hypothetical protein
MISAKSTLPKVFLPESLHCHGRTATLLRRAFGLGGVTPCVGGGQGMAVVVERLA